MNTNFTKAIFARCKAVTAGISAVLLVGSFASSYGQSTGNYTLSMKEYRGNGKGAPAATYPVVSNAFGATSSPADGLASKTRMGANGLTFELWATKLHPWDGQDDYLIGRRFVSSYTPRGEVEVVTHDQMHVSKKRTREDIAYDMTVTVSGMESDDYDTARVKHSSLFLVRGFKEARPDPLTPGKLRTGAYTPAQDYGSQTTPTSLKRVLKNGVHAFRRTITPTSPVNPNTAPDPKTHGIYGILGRPDPAPFGYGTDEWRIETYATNGVNGVGTGLDAEIVANDTASLLPKSTADWSTTAVDSRGNAGENRPLNEVETFGIDDINRTFTVKVNDIYPYSRTYMHVYPGPPRAAGQPVVTGNILGTYEIFDTEGTFTYETSFTKRLGDIVPDAGTYTIEIVTDVSESFPGTPPEAITGGVITFNFDMGMKVRAGIDTEK